VSLSRLWYIASGQGVMRIVSTDNGAQEAKFAGGAQQISDKLAATLRTGHDGTNRPGDGVFFDHAVCEIVYGDEKLSKTGRPSDDILTFGDDVMVKCSNGARFHASTVILAISPVLYQKIHFFPRLPGLRNQLCQSMSMGCIVKTITRYRAPFWRKGGAPGSELNYSCNLFSDEGPISFTYDDSHEDEGKDGFYAIMGFCYADQARKWMERTQQERKEAICQQYFAGFKHPMALEPIDYFEQNWAEETWSGGCYVGVMVRRA
jgi:monoamine oxidase